MTQIYVIHLNPTAPKGYWHFPEDKLNQLYPDHSKKRSVGIAA